MKALPWRHIFAGFLAAFFLLGGSMNIFASDAILADYHRWGYPGWFHYLTGALEWTTAVLIAIPRSRLLGSLLGCALMTSAAATVLLHGEYAHALAPLIVLTLVALNGGIAWRHAARARAGLRPF